MSSTDEEDGIIDIESTNFSLRPRRFKIIPEPLIIPSNQFRRESIPELRSPVLDPSDNSRNTSELGNLEDSEEDDLMDDEKSNNPSDIKRPRGNPNWSRGRKKKKQSTHHVRWTNEEDTALIESIKIYGYGKWLEISSAIKTRTPNQAKNRARHLKFNTSLLNDALEKNQSGTLQANEILEDEQEDDKDHLQTDDPELSLPTQISNEASSDLEAENESIKSDTDNSIDILKASTEADIEIEKIDFGSPEALDYRELPRTVITSLEMKTLPEWLRSAKSTNSTKQATKNPLKYLKIRNFILDEWKGFKQQSKYLTKSYIRQHIKETDYNAISKIFDLLEKNRFINVGVYPKRGRNKQQIAPEIEEKKEFELVQLNQGNNLFLKAKVKINQRIIFLMDLHAHFFNTEIIGLLGGDHSFDEDRGEIQILVKEIFPCHQHISEDVECELDPLVELNAREYFEHKGLSMVGWYHSHPHFPVYPSRRDLETQEMWQSLLNIGYAADEIRPEPFIGIIISPYNPTSEGIVSSIECFHLGRDKVTKERVAYKPRIESAESDISKEDLNTFLRCIKTTTSIEWERMFKNGKSYFESMIHSLELNSRIKPAKDVIDMLKEFCF